MIASKHFDLSDRVAIVTGGTRGIGLAIAQGLSEAGADVVPTSRTNEDVDAATTLIRNQGSRTIALPTDVTSKEDVSTLVESTYDELGGIDILVNNAGVNPAYALGRPEDIDPKGIEDVLDVNLRGAFSCVQAAGDYLLASDHGVVINIASIGGVIGLPRQHPYVASKHGLVGLTKSMALDWAPDVRVNAIAPGYVTTDLTSEIQKNDKLRKSILKQTPLSRFATPVEVAGPAIFLASDAATYITGHCLAVDGGWTAK
ncbi:3-oxoacyl-ACP reductase FabG [Halorubraceae archaeon YAN]|nr:3-oxoacyl-ACP reductase FabG [Halorubraceae archaeon YAN]